MRSFLQIVRTYLWSLSASRCHSDSFMERLRKIQVEGTPSIFRPSCLVHILHAALRLDLWKFLLFLGPCKQSCAFFCFMKETDWTSCWSWGSHERVHLWPVTHIPSTRVGAFKRDISRIAWVRSKEERNSWIESHFGSNLVAGKRKRDGRMYCWVNLAVNVLTTPAFKIVFYEISSKIWERRKLMYGPQICIWFSTWKGLAWSFKRSLYRW